MFIETEETPNPNALKFLLEANTIEIDKTIDITNIECAKKISPMSEKFMMIEEVTGVLFGRDFITITKLKNAIWGDLKSGLQSHILSLITEYISSKKEIFNEIPEEKNEINLKGIEHDVKDEGIVREIWEVIENYIRPAVAGDGGNIELKGFTSKRVVQLELQGACSGCPSASITLKQGVERMLQHYVPKVLGVEQTEEKK